MTFSLQCAAFTNEGDIPRNHTCDGADVSPALAWSDPPTGTQSFSLIMDDPDAPAGTWVHWVLYDLPVRVAELPQGVPPDETLANGAKQGVNDFRKVGYGGPCPPPGKPHRYFFTLYALDTTLRLPVDAGRARLDRAMGGHVLAQTRLVGTYTRNRG